VTFNQETPRENVDFSPSDFISTTMTRHATKLISHINDLREIRSSESTHACRVAIRTINAHLNTFAPFLRRKPTTALSQQLAWLNKKLGDIRGLDVMIALITDIENEQVKQGLITRLHSQRLSQELKLKKFFEVPELDLLLKDLANFALHPPLRRKFAKLNGKKSKAKVTAAISHTWVLLFDQLESLPKRPNAKQLHRLRIATKECRYAYEAASETNLLQSPHIQAWTKQLQKQLGRVQDIKILRTWIKKQTDLDPLVKTQALIYFAPNLPTKKQLLGGAVQIPK